MNIRICSIRFQFICGFMAADIVYMQTQKENIGSVFSEKKRLFSDEYDEEIGMCATVNLHYTVILRY